MKLVRFGPSGKEQPGLIDADGKIRDLSAHVSDIDGAALQPASLDRLRALDAQTLPPIDGSPRLGPCIKQPVNFVCIGMNYADHAKESGHAVPSEPIIFLKAASAISGPNDDVEKPRGSIKMDWEVELGVVIGKRAKYVSEDTALDHVAGYCLVNDVSERHYQHGGTGQWTKGKSHDTFGPTGPWLLTADEVADPQALNLWLDLNGERQQSGSTSDMIFGVKHLIAYTSAMITLNPGDILATGTPSGIGDGQTPPRYLTAGDVVTLSIDGLGVQETKIVDA